MRRGLRAGWWRTAAEPADWTPVEGPLLPEDRTVHTVLDLALRIGDVRLASGASAADTEATIMAVTGAYGLPHCEVDVIFTSISVACHLGQERAPVTSLRVVRSRSLDYTRLANLDELTRDISAGKVPLHEAHTRLEAIRTANHPYPRWVATLAWAGMAAAVTVLIGGTLAAAGWAALITAFVDRVGRLLNRRRLPFFFQQLVGGLLATGAALALLSSDLLPGARPSTLVGAAITVLLSGLSVVSTVQDAISGYNVTAAGRAMEVFMMTAGLIAGVVVALNVSTALGMPFQPLADPLPPSALRLPVQALAGGLAAACFALACYAAPKAVPMAGAAGALGATAAAGLLLTGPGPVASSAVAATAVGFLGGLLARRLRMPPLIVAVSGMVPLLPGLTTYRALYELAVEQSTAGLPTLMSAGGIALALAAGVVLGEYLAQPVRSGLGRLERRIHARPVVSGRRPAGK